VLRCSTCMSPLVDRELIDHWRKTDAPRTFRREVLAEWVDEAGAYFAHAELEALADDYELVLRMAAERIPDIVRRWANTLQWDNGSIATDPGTASTGASACRNT
jgi:hypothetical protein